MEAVKVTEPPWQNVVFPPGVINATGKGLTVTVKGAEVPEHPLPFVTVTVGVVVVVTLID